MNVDFSGPFLEVLSGIGSQIVSTFAGLWMVWLTLAVLAFLRFGPLRFLWSRR